MNAESVSYTHLLFYLFRSSDNKYATLIVSLCLLLLLLYNSFAENVNNSILHDITPLIMLITRKHRVGLSRTLRPIDNWWIHVMTIRQPIKHYISLLLGFIILCFYFNSSPFDPARYFHCTNLY